MKWEKPNGSVQYSVDRKYCIVHATQENWIAYELGPTTGKELGIPVDTDERARAICEDHENMLVALKKRA